MIVADHSKIKEALPELIKLLNERKLNLAESAFLLSLALRSVGESFYDRNAKDLKSVADDYLEQPTIPAALIIHADQIPVLFEMFKEKMKVDNGSEFK